MKVLIYSSKELYEKSSYAGRAEAHLIAYAIPGLYGNMYVIVKDRHGVFYAFERNNPIVCYKLKSFIHKYERDHDDSPLIPEMPQ